MNRPMLERITKIHKKISSGCYPNTKELAYDLEISIPTVSRDIEYMRDRMSAPIVYDKLNNGYYYENKFEMPIYTLSEKDAEILAVTELMLSYFKNTPVYEEACNIIELLSESVIEKGGSFLRGRIALAPSAKSKIENNLWNSICLAMKDNLIVEFDYSGRGNTETEHRIVNPYQIVLDNGSVFLFGYSEERNAERLFSLNRIKNFKVTERTFNLPTDYNFESRCGGGKFGAFKGGKTEKCTVIFFDEARAVAKDSLWADDQIIKDNETENSTTITFTSTQTYKVLEWILSQGKNAVPVEPKWLVDEWIENVKSMDTFCKSVLLVK